jgi:hypothetical protein
MGSSTSRYALFLGLAAALACSAGGRAVASGQQPSPERIDALVRELGSDTFAVRERATRELIGLGIVTRDALSRAAKDSDAEVRVRARAVLETVTESDFQERLDAFSADYDGSHRVTLPAWEQFSEQFGSSRLARELFVEMQRAEGELLAAMAAGTKQASQALSKRARDVLEGQREVHLQLGTLATFLFVASAEGVTVDHDGAGQLLPYVVQLTYQRNSKSAFWPVVLKRMVGRWLAKDATPETAAQNLMLAAHLELRSEALSVAARILASDDKLLTQINSRMVAVLVVARFGDKSHVAMLEKLLDDASPSPARPENVPGKVQMQIRDIVLAVLVQLTDQELREYGEVAEHPYGAMGFQTPAFTFASDEARGAALAKWAAWRGQHPDS